MKLSLMKKVLDTVNEEWKSPMGEFILDRWRYDHGSVYFYRASANFIFVFRQDGKKCFLRFNVIGERNLEEIQAEVEMLHLLPHVAKPIPSKYKNDIEVVDTEIGTVYAVVFEGLPGKQLEFDELDDAKFFKYGKALGTLHHHSQSLPKSIKRPSWNDQIHYLKECLQMDEKEILNELIRIESKLKLLPVNNENYGIIHYDYELDNICWDNDNIYTLDFDDSAYYWFVADIAYALRDLFDETINLTNHSFIQFIEGYKETFKLDEQLINEIPLFLKLHQITIYVRLRRAVDIDVSSEHPEWLNSLINKLKSRIDNNRKTIIGIYK